MLKKRSTAVDGRRTRAVEGSSARPWRLSRIWPRILILALAFPGAALAQLDFPPILPPQTHFNPYADGAYEHDSNLFAISSSAPEPLGGNGRPSLSDTIWKARAGFDSAYDLGLQEFFLIAEFRHFSYDEFTQLTHDEYLVHGGWNWKVASILDGVIDYSRERSMVSFLTIDTEEFSAKEQLFLQVQSIATASINIQMTPEWRLQSQGKLNDQQTQLPGDPATDTAEENVTLHEESIHEGLRYVGFANLSAGLDGVFLRGNYTGGPFLVTPGYRQSTAEFAADYVLSGLSSFHGDIGYTDRVMEEAGSISGLTGLAIYQRDLTGKTSITLKVGRAINTYITAASPEVDTSGEVDVTWNATTKIKVQAGYQYLHSAFSATELAGALPTASRVDRLQTPTFSVMYQPTNWLLIHPYAQYQTRDSTQGIFTFHGTVYGLELEGRLQFQ
jgi:hypothetical protein